MIAKTLLFSIVLCETLFHVHNFIRLAVQLYKCKCTNNDMGLSVYTVLCVHKHICTESCDLYLHLQESLECLGNGDLLQFFKFVDAALDEGTQFIAVIQLVLPEGTQKQQTVHKQ